MISLTSPDFRTLVRVFEAERRTLLAANEWVDPDRPHASRIDLTPPKEMAVAVQCLSSAEDRVGAFTLRAQTYRSPGP